jgi:hypothetical protein
MLFDGIELTGTSVVANLTVESDSDFPADNLNGGELFYKIDHGLHVYTGTQWVPVGGSGGSGGANSDGIGVSLVQVGDGSGGFLGVPAPAGADLVLTSNTIGLPTWEPAQVSGGTVTSVNIIGGTTGLSFGGGPITTEGDLIADGVLTVEHGGTGATSVAGIVANILPDQTGNQGAALITDGDSLSWQVLPGSAYTAGTGLALQGSEFNSTVAVNDGVEGRVPVTVGDGTLTNLAAGSSGYVLTSNGDGVPPSWQNVSGTVTEIQIYNDPTVGLTINGGDEMSPPQTGRTKINTTGQISLTGTLAVQHGGTGAASASGAITNLLPAQVSGKFLTTNGTAVSWGDVFPLQTSNAGKFLKTDGSTVSWETPAGGGTVTSVGIDGADTGLTFSDGPITQSGTFTVGGSLAVQHGGTGATTASAAITNLLPAQSGNTGKILTTNGTAAYWSDTGAGSVTSVSASGGTTGLSFGGGPITTSGALTLSGTLALTNGGTGATTASQAVTNLLPPQTGNTGKVLATDGASVYWSESGGSGSGSVTSVDISGGSTGMSFSGGPITSSGTITLSGVLGVTYGGTGANTQNGALNNLLPAQTGNSGKILTTNGTSASWTTSSAGSVTSVNVSGGATGLTFSGGPITDSGTLTAGGTLAIANGGTGASSAQAARNNILPAQTSNNGFVLTTNGTDVAWTNPSTISAAAGSTTHVQYNKNGAFVGASTLTFNDSTGALSASSFSGNGASLTNLNGSNIATGTVAVARLGSGTPTSSTYLRGDGAWTTHYDAKYDLALSITGKPAASAYVLTFIVVNAFSLPAGLSGSSAKASTSSTGTATFTINKNGSSIGTIAFAASSTGSFTFSSSQTFAAGDMLQIVAPGSQDATLANIGITLKGTLTA